jgi:UDP-N-acetylmuramate dehydrogenase
MTPDWRYGLADGDGLRVLLDEPMNSHTTYRVGGSTQAFIKVTELSALETSVTYLAEQKVPFAVVGKGSNVLFSDAAYAGAVIQLSRGFDAIELREEDDGFVLRVGASLSITKLIRYLKDQELAGLECLGGIPGTVGGAVKMNAGTVMGEVKDSLLRVRIVQPNTPAYWIDAPALELGYRHSVLPANSVVIAAEFTCRRADAETFERLEQVLSYRKKTQPLRMPSCGSVFANPPGDHAGRLIEACGLKGERVGGAQISEKHANWIVNVGQATASDVHSLMQLCVRTVQQQFGVNLRHEVQYLGDWTQA